MTLSITGGGGPQHPLGQATKKEAHEDVHVDMTLQLMAQLAAVQLLAVYLMKDDKWHAITCVPAGSRSHSL